MNDPPTSSTPPQPRRPNPGPAVTRSSRPMLSVLAFLITMRSITISAAALSIKLGAAACGGGDKP
jgi:hypothetical protein